MNAGHRRPRAATLTMLQELASASDLRLPEDRLRMLTSEVQSLLDRVDALYRLDVGSVLPRSPFGDERWR